MVCSDQMVLEKIKQSNKNGATVIYTSHYMEKVEAICTRIAIMDNGKVIACGTSEELKKLVTDDSAFVRDGMRIILEVDDEFEVLGCAANGKEAIEIGEAAYTNPMKYSTTIATITTRAEIIKP